MQLFRSCSPCCWALLLGPAWQGSPQLNGGPTAGDPFGAFINLSGFTNPGTFTRAVCWATDVNLSLSLATYAQLEQAPSLILVMYTLDLRHVHNKLQLPRLA